MASHIAYEASQIETFCVFPDFTFGDLPCNAPIELNGGSMSEGNITIPVEMELQMLTEHGNTIQLIDDAIERLVDGEYGICMDCGEPISEARLMARPYAVYCIKCKSRHEEMMKYR
jgi:hypothetical protein